MPAQAESGPTIQRPALENAKVRIENDSGHRASIPGAHHCCDQWPERPPSNRTQVLQDRGWIRNRSWETKWGKRRRKKNKASCGALRGKGGRDGVMAGERAAKPVSTGRRNSVSVK